MTRSYLQLQWVNVYMYNDAFLDTAAYWVNFPNTPVPGPVKFYYFLAFAFYGTAMVILNIEEHRKDHWQMFSHHIITVALIGVSWVTHISRPGIQILVLLDWCDIFLPVSIAALPSSWLALCDCAIVIAVLLLSPFGFYSELNYVVSE